MRSLLIGSVFLVAAACSTAPDQARYDARGEEKLQKLLAGKVAGQPQSCLQSFRSADMVRIDDDTILFRNGGNRVYRNETRGACSGLANSNYALVTKTHGTGLCRGDIAQLVDLTSGIQAGSCVLGDFVPYTTPRG